jgi:hypothetical protein
MKHPETPFSTSSEGKLVRLAGLEPAYVPFQDCRSRVFHCLSLHIKLRQFANQIKGYFATTGSFRQDSLCKTRANLLAVQNLCKMRCRAGICAIVVQGKNPSPIIQNAAKGKIRAKAGHRGGRRKQRCL